MTLELVRGFRGSVVKRELPKIGTTKDTKGTKKETSIATKVLIFLVCSCIFVFFVVD